MVEITHRTLIIHTHGSLSSGDSVMFEPPPNKSIVLFGYAGKSVKYTSKGLNDIKNIYKNGNSLYNNNDKNETHTKAGLAWLNKNTIYRDTDGNIKERLFPYRFYRSNYGKNNYFDEFDTMPNLKLQFGQGGENCNNWGNKGERSCYAELVELYANGTTKSSTELEHSQYILLSDLIELYPEVNSFIVLACLVNRTEDDETLQNVKNIQKLSVYADNNRLTRGLRKSYKASRGKLATISRGKSKGGKSKRKRKGRKKKSNTKKNI
jgi:hypothetical protein|tara:strand:- start:216 stop:1010 length:795 start_codon:yes stop_codon:yes gene_type:complete